MPYKLPNFGRIHGPLVVGLLLAMPLLLLGVYLAFQQDAFPVQNAERPMTRSRQMTVGGVDRPGSDVTSRGSRFFADDARPKLGEFNADLYGRQPQISKNANPAVSSAYEAMVEAKHPERISPMLPPPPFDPAAYAADPDAYLNTHEPGRIWQTAQPGPDVPVLAPLSAGTHTLTQGESVRLQVQSPAGLPVTFTAFDLGTFENQLTTISVPANDDGVATATFTATPGSLFRAHVLAASPGASGQVHFEIYIQPKAEGPAQ